MKKFEKIYLGVLTGAMSIYLASFALFFLGIFSKDFSHEVIYDTSILVLIPSVFCWIGMVIENRKDEKNDS